ncbi:P-loop containing nucleoside triphosphate hydrolase protein [Xylariaceae sp. FL0662B]|nr:P-loop containing nucleoside triphosphate hydrolase protein [Xylariaceae sp. FL0662B]
MYARYIPPPKGVVENPEPQRAVASPSTNTTKSQPTAYARYIPSAKPITSQASNQASQHIHFGENDDNGPPAKKVKLMQEETPKDSDRKPKKPKKDKKKKAKSLETPANEASTTLPAAQHGQSDGENDIQLGTHDQQQTVQKPAVEPKKEKKRKKKSKKVGTEVDADVDDDVQLRHRAILEKAAKSIQKVSEPEPTADNTDVPMQDEPAAKGDAEASADDIMDVDSNTIEAHGLQPLPQPEPAVPETAKPTYETLPSWLAQPIRVSPQTIMSFTDFGLSPDLGITDEVAERLAASGYERAFAIQTAVIPLLLPHHCRTMQGDILVSAATGSGKTLSYALPVVRDISNGNRHVTRLRAIIVLPTRELVRQVQQVCEQCAGMFTLNGSKKRVRVGIAMGSQSIDQEQTALIEREERYDPEAYIRRTRRLASDSGYASDENEGYHTEDEDRAAIQKREDKIPTLPEYVITYNSKVDILICTPGRLVEHIKYTPGFSLDFVRWLVVDEADKLLGQNFQQWLDVVIPRLQANDKGARNHKQSNLSGVRKVILSATMTRDLDRLEGLKLRWPKLVVLEGSGANDEPEVHATQAELALPELLQEAALKVSDPNLKPLFLLDLLQSDHLLGGLPQKPVQELSDDSSSDDTSSSGSDSETSLVSLKPPSTTEKLPTVLVFTKSNETALRLSRLLSLLSPALGSLVGTLTSTTPYTTRRQTIRSFLAGKLRILVASDLVARGIDLPSLDHVVNYDMPVSVASYVHRVGRTARAGKRGKAWTLFTNPEARWFWVEVASETVIRRTQRVERIRVTEEKEDAFNEKVGAYELALETLGQEASGAKSRGR